MNLVLADTEEFRKIKPNKPTYKEREHERVLFLILLIGDNIVTTLFLNRFSNIIKNKS